MLLVGNARKGSMLRWSSVFEDELAFCEPCESECDNRDGFEPEEVSTPDFPLADEMDQTEDGADGDAGKDGISTQRIDKISLEFHCGLMAGGFRLRELKEAEKAQSNEKQSGERKMDCADDALGGCETVLWFCREKSYSEGKETGESTGDRVTMVVALGGKKKQGDGAQTSDKDIPHICVVVSADGEL